MKKEARSFKLKLKNLININLLDNKDKIGYLYKWENLFNYLNPVLLYISLKKLKLEKKNKKSESNGEIYENKKDYKSPILLVDLPRDKINLFFNRKSSPSEKKININSEKKVTVYSQYRCTHLAKNYNCLEYYYF